MIPGLSAETAAELNEFVGPDIFNDMDEEMREYIEREQ